MEGDNMRQENLALCFQVPCAAEAKTGCQACGDGKGLQVLWLPESWTKEKWDMYWDRYTGNPRKEYRVFVLCVACMAQGGRTGTRSEQTGTCINCGTRRHYNATELLCCQLVRYISVSDRTKVKRKVHTETCRYASGFGCDEV